MHVSKLSDFSTTWTQVGSMWQLGFLAQGTPMTSAEFLRALLEDAALRAVFNASLAQAPFSAFRWECPPIDAATLGQPFECMLIDAPELARAADATPFAPHLAAASNEEVVRFANLGGDATLVVPCPLGPLVAYPHLAAFVRNAPETQRDALWRCVVDTVLTQRDKWPLWLSTAGDGVAWLHVRLDARPKYYRCARYRSP